jgi:hypothetical protein
MNTVSCRYNPNHKLKIAKLPQHEDKCPDRFGKNIKQCPYNVYHKIKSHQYENHLNECENRPQTIGTDLEKELKEYLSKQYKICLPITQNTKQKKIIGIKRKEDRTEEKKLKRLLNKSEVLNENFEEIEKDYTFDADWDTITEKSFTIEDINL